MDIARTGGAVCRAWLRLPEVTLERLWSIAPVVAGFCAVANTRIALADFWWHLKVGEMIATTGSIPTTDTLSFVTYGQPYLYAQWLGELYFYVLFSLGGLALVVFNDAVVVAAVGWCVFSACREATSNVRAASVLALMAVLLARPSTDARPQIFGILFFAVCYLILIRHSIGGGRALWLMLPVAVVWANVHGSAVLAIGLCGAFFGAETLKLLACGRLGPPLPGHRVVALGAVTTALPLAMAMNPAGLRFFDYALNVQTSAVVRNWVTEWAPPSINDQEHALFFLALFAYLLLLAVSREPLALTEIALFVLFLMMGLQAVRNLVWLGIVAAPMFARLLPDVVTRARHAIGGWGARASSRSRSPAFVGQTVAALLLLGCVISTPWAKLGLQGKDAVEMLADGETPTAAVSYISEHLLGERVFTPIHHAGYVAWQVPGQLIFVDGRLDLYPYEALLDYRYIASGIEWEQVLGKYGMDYALVPEVGRGADFVSGLRRGLAEAESAGRWVTIHNDGKARIYARTKG